MMQAKRPTGWSAGQRTATLCGAVLLAAAQGQASELNRTDLKVRETPIGYRPTMADPTTWLFNSDNTAAACQVRYPNRWSVWLNGKETELFVKVSELRFSPDGRRFAFGGSRGPDQAVLVVDGTETPTSSLVRLVQFSPDSRHLAYMDSIEPKGTNWGRPFVVRDGKAGPLYDSISPDEFLYSPDSQRFAYGVGRRVPPTPGKPERTVDTPGFAGLRFAVDGLVVVDGVESLPYDEVGKETLQFSSDSRRVAFLGKRDGLWRVVVDGKEEAAYEAVGTPSLNFSPDSKRLAYTAKKAGKWMMVLDGKEGAPYDVTADGKVVFSPDSQRVAFIAKQDGKFFVVVNGEAGEAMDAVGGGGIAFSPDSKRFAFIGAKGREARLYLDRKPTGGKMHEVSNAKPEFSPDGSRIAWLGARGGKYLVCEAESEGKPYDAVITGSIMFSPDSKHLAYVAERDRQAVVVVDGAESPLYEDGGKIVFVTPEHLRAIVQRFDKMFREELIMVDIELGGGETEVRK